MIRGLLPDTVWMETDWYASIRILLNQVIPVLESPPSQKFSGKRKYTVTVSDDPSRMQKGISSQNSEFVRIALSWISNHHDIKTVFARNFWYQGGDNRSMKAPLFYG